MTEISRDFFAYLTLIKLDFIDIKDSIDWDMASKPDADFIFCGEFNINSGTQQVHLRARGRQARVKVSSFTDNTYWRYGAVRLDIKPDGGR